MARPGTGRRQPDRDSGSDGARISGSRRPALVVGGAVAVAAAALIVWRTSGDAGANEYVDPANYAAAAAAGPLPTEVFQCARCHIVPPRDLLPSARWPYLLDKMHALIDQYDLGTPVAPAHKAKVHEYYVDGSPATETLLPERYAPSPLRFNRSPLGTRPDPASGPMPFVSALTVTDLDADGEIEVLVSDAIAKRVTAARLREGRWTEEPLAEVEVPARTEVADLNGDGRLDVAIAVLGGVQPTDDEIGQVVLLLSDGAGGYEQRTVLDGVTRVCDVRAADLDGDQDLDLLVAIFGLFKTGAVGWLERGADGGYRYHEIMARTGFSHVVPMELDGDAHVDFVALSSQEHEEVLAFVNDGSGTFSARQLFKAPHPMYGCSGLTAVDLDRDGDQDLLFTNGDSLDIDAHPKPWHGVQWLENRGNLHFEYHDIWRFYGAYAALAEDLDGDGDLDIVVTSMMNVWGNPSRQSIAWLENDGTQCFIPHPLDNDPTALVSLAIADFNGDERPDVLAGGMYVMPPYQRARRLTLWFNRGHE